MTDYRENYSDRVLYSDESPMFRTPACPRPGDVVTIRFRTAADDAEEVLLVCGGTRIPMEKRPVPWQEAGGAFDYYAADIRVGGEEVSYHFEIRRGGEIWTSNRRGTVWVCEPQDEFRVVPGCSVPDWAQGAVFYQIFVDRFANGDPSNDVRSGEYDYLGMPVTRAESWNSPVREPDVGRFFGGDLQGVIDKLDYLQGLGVEAIYLNPIFVSPSTHKYDTQDYDHVDPHFGRIVNDGDYVRRVTDPENLRASDALFAELTAKAHARGIRVILDGVFNHCGSFHKWMDREGIYREAASRGVSCGPEGAYHRADSPYRDYFRFAEEDAWPENGSYEGWWGHRTLPKLNYEDSEKLQEEILRIAEKWVSPPYNADGWRLDVAADLGHSPEFNHRFWQKFRRRVKAARPDALILAEHYGWPGDYLRGGEWDSVMNYDAFMEPVTWLLTGMEKHSDVSEPELRGDVRAFSETTRRAKAAFGGGALLAAMNELDNHDHSRFLTRTNHTVGRLASLGSAAASENVRKHVLRQAVLMQMTWPGCPTVYYGDEAGLAGFTDPDDRRPFPWGKEDADLLAFYRRAIAMHRENPVLRKGSLIRIPCYKPGESASREEVPGVLAYGRFDENGAVLTVINAGSASAEFVLPVLPLGIGPKEEGSEFACIFRTDRRGWTDGGGRVIAREGLLCLAAEPESASVFRS